MRYLVAVVWSTVLAILGGGVCRANTTDEFGISQTQRLPAPFTRFTAEDALAAVFPSYHPGSSVVREVEPGGDGDPVRVGFAEAGTWRADGETRLVVRFEIGVAKEIGLNLCGPCLEDNGLALLDERAGRLHVVATNYSADGDADIRVSGNDDLSFDLAPYRFDATHAMIGIRQNHSSGPGDLYEEYLNLFFVRGSKLVLAGFLPLGTISVIPADDTSLDLKEAVVIVDPGVSGRPNDLLVRSRLMRCPHDPTTASPFACGPKHGEAVRSAWTIVRYRYLNGAYRTSR